TLPLLPPLNLITILTITKQNLGEPNGPLHLLHSVFTSLPLTPPGPYDTNPINAEPFKTIALHNLSVVSDFNPGSRSGLMAANKKKNVGSVVMEEEVMSKLKLVSIFDSSALIDAAALGEYTKTISDFSVFICEQKLYSKAQLKQHIDTDDSEVDGSESERGGFLLLYKVKAGRIQGPVEGCKFLVNQRKQE
ncbi:hypothetical protein M8C21_032297, partial [Ambrosia artemisiifolia]